MACGGCKARGDAILKGARAAAKGDLTTVTEQTKFLARTMVQDAGSALRQKAAAARNRLSMRR